MKRSSEASDTSASKRRRSTEAKSSSSACLEFFHEEIRKLEEKKISSNETFYQIFEICGVDTKTNGFDSEGDNDLLNINFAGKIVRGIRRSVLTKPQFGCNYFSCLFQKRWDCFHPRDKDGRIYVDIEEEWLRPLLDYIIYYQTPLRSLKIDEAIDSYFFGIFSYFKLSEVFSDGPFYPLDVNSRPVIASKELTANIPDLEQSLSTDCKYTCLKKLHFPVLDFSESDRVKRASGENLTTYTRNEFRGMKLLFSVYPIRITRFVCCTDLCCHSFLSLNSVKTYHNLILWERDCMEVFYPHAVVSLNPRKRIEKYESFLKEVDVLENVGQDSLFPLSFLMKKEDETSNCTVSLVITENGFVWVTDTEDGETRESECSTIEIFEVAHFKMNRILYEKPKTRENNFPQSSSNTDDQKFCEKFQEFLNKYDQELKCTKYVEEELLFMKSYFHHIYQGAQLSKQTDTISFFAELWNHIQVSSINGSNENDTNPIIYFNLDYEIFPILRSTIAQFIPESQLAIRISGRWKEKQQSEHIDTEGNLIISTDAVHPYAFKDILSSLRLANLLQDENQPLTIFLRGNSGYFIDEALDYLGVLPAFLSKISS
jgi:hypothetical protein